VNDSHTAQPPQTPSKLGAAGAIVFSLAAIAWFASEVAVTVIGGVEPDDAVGVLGLITRNPAAWTISGFALLLMAVALLPAVFATSEVLAEADRSTRVVTRSLAALGVIAAALFFLMGVLRQTSGPLAFFAEIDRAAGIAATASVQLIGAHGAAQGGILAVCLWAVGVGVEGLRTRTLPVWLGVLGVIPALRVLALVLGPVLPLPDWTWFVAIAAVPLSMLWPLALGVALLMERRRAATRR
jgi:hypothetical protein